MKKAFFAALSLLYIFSAVFFTGWQASASADLEGYDVRYYIINPYENVDWATVNHVKAALHTHSSNSGVVWNDSGLTDPDNFIRGYENAGFGALVITDHDYVSYPWANGNSVSPPSNVNSPNSTLLTTAGNELSKNAHTLSYGTRYFDRYNPDNVKNQTDSEGYDQNIINVGNTPNIYGSTGGIVYLAHPRRNDPNESRKDDAASHPYSDLWWLSKFQYEHVKGIEVLNCGQFSVNHSERLWDSLLSKSMPSRFIFGTASDDNHGSTSTAPTSNLGTGYTMVLIAPENMNSKGLFDALAAGTTYFSTHMLINNVNGPNDDNKPRPDTPQPRIYSITVDNEAGTITVETDYAYKVEWISGVNEDNTASRVIKTDNNPGGGNSPQRFFSTFDVNGDYGAELKGYVRFRIIGNGGQTHGQPFGLERQVLVSDEDYSIDFINEKVTFGSKIKMSLSQSFLGLLASGSPIEPGSTLYARAAVEDERYTCVVKAIEIPERPEAPKLSLSSRSDTIIKLSQVTGAQYRINGGPWQDSSQFTGLQPDTEYQFEARIKATSTSFASPIAIITIRTREGAPRQSSPFGCGSYQHIGFAAAGIVFLALLGKAALNKRT